MNFEEKLEQLMQRDNSAIDHSRFILNLNQKLVHNSLRRARLISSLSTTLLLIVLGWTFSTQLGEDPLVNLENAYFEESEYFELDSLEYENYIADLAIFLVENEDVWNMIEFFDETDYFNEKIIKEISL